MLIFANPRHVWIITINEIILYQWKKLLWINIVSRENIQLHIEVLNENNYETQSPKRYLVSSGSKFDVNLKIDEKNCKQFRLVSHLTCPVWPWGTAWRLRVGVVWWLVWWSDLQCGWWLWWVWWWGKWGTGAVSTTPALVPTHNRSLHASKAVTLRHAALCCLMISSQAGDAEEDKALLNTSLSTIIYLILFLFILP